MNDIRAQIDSAVKRTRKASLKAGKLLTWKEARTRVYDAWAKRLTMTHIYRAIRMGRGRMVLHKAPVASTTPVAPDAQQGNAVQGATTAGPLTDEQCAAMIEDHDAWPHGDVP